MRVTVSYGGGKHQREFQFPLDVVDLVYKEGKWTELETKEAKWTVITAEQIVFRSSLGGIIKLDLRLAIKVEITP